LRQRAICRWALPWRPSLYLYVGSRRLAGLVGSKGRNHRREQGYKVLFGIFALLFAVNFYLHATQVRGDYGMPRFTFPINILMFSYLLPSIVMWALGLLACANLAWYARHTPGTIYKRLFRQPLPGYFDGPAQHLYVPTAPYFSSGLHRDE